MLPNRRIDQLVAENIMTFGARTPDEAPSDKLPYYSSDDEDAFRLVDHLLTRGFRGFYLQYKIEGAGHFWTASFMGNMPIDEWTEEGPTRAMAICRAALSVFGIGTNEAST